MRIFANPFQVPTPRQPIRKLRIAVVGTGHWGTNLARNLHASRDWQVAAI
ncbi:UNVERIFIED_ORG: ketol-acid reductoisomerase [Arthrobacter sp. UYEF13]